MCCKKFVSQNPKIARQDEKEDIKLNQWEIFSPYFQEIEVPAKILLHERKSIQNDVLY